jgi:hypothetical protein
VSGLLIFALVYTSIICAIESSVSPVLALFVTFYALMSLSNYFGICEHVVIDTSASFFAVLKLSLLALGYSADSLVMRGSVDLSFIIMTVLLCFDAFYGLSVYLSAPQFMTEKKTFNKKSSVSATICMDNWKSNLFRSNEVTLKSAALFVFALQLIASVSALAYTSILSVAVLAYTVVGLVTFFQRTSSDFLQAFHSYFASLLVSTLIIVNICFFGFSTANTMLAVVFIGDAITGLTLLKRSINMEIFSVTVDNASLLSKALKPTYADDFKFVNEHFQQV